MEPTERSPNDLRTIAVPGQPVPGSPDEKWGYAPEFGINNAGTIAFRASAGGR
jgi:hypothetical protein